jgi:hypothetical protein
MRRLRLLMTVAGAAALAACGSASGPQPTSPHATSTPSPTWSIGTQINRIGADDYLEGLSCPSAAFCVAVDESGYVYTYSGGSWSSGSQIDANPYPSDDLTDVSCPNDHFCMAVDFGGYAYAYSNGVWSAGAPIVATPGAELNAISCASATFCVAVDNNGFAYTYFSGAWSSGTHIDTHAYGNYGGIFNGVACPTMSFCVALAGDGYEYTYANGAWSSGTYLFDAAATEGDLGATISCPTAAYCLAIDMDGNVHTYSGGVWQSVASGNPWLTDFPFSCGSVGFCIGLVSSASGESACPYSLSSLSNCVVLQTGIQPGATLISCPSTTFCMAIAPGGRAHTYSNG